MNQFTSAAHARKMNPLCTTRDGFLLLKMLHDQEMSLIDRSSNDWSYPREWSLPERQQFFDRVKNWAVGTEYEDHPFGEFQPTLGPPDFIVLNYLAFQLKRLLI